MTEEEKTEARAAAEQLAAQPLQVRYQEAQRAAGASPYGQIPAMLSFERSMTPEETELFKAQYALGTALADRAGMSGPFAAAAGLVSALPGATWADREGTKAQQAMTPKPFRSPLTPEGWSPYTQAREEHPVAYGAGAVAGNVGVTLAGGKLADAAVKTTPLLRHLPKAAQTVLSTGLNFGGQAALRTAENGGDAGQIVKAGVTNALAGMAGQGVGQMVHGGAVKLLGHLNLSNSIPANVAASATEGVSFAGTQMGTRMLLDEDYRPSGEEAAVDLTSAAAFSALSRYLQTRAQSKEAAVRLQADAEDMKRDFQRIANNMYVNGPEATLYDLELKIARTRGAINANTYMGQQETVNAINEFLDTLDEAISMKRLELGAIPGTAVDAGSVTGAPAYGWEAPAFTPHSESTNGGGGYLMGLVPEIPPRPVQQSPRDILSRLAWEMAAGDDPLGDLAKDDMLAILDQIARRQSGEVNPGEEDVVALAPLREYDGNVQIIEKFSPTEYVISVSLPSISGATQHFAKNLTSKPDRAGLTATVAQGIIENRKLVLWQAKSQTLKIISDDGYVVLNLQGRLITVVPEKLRRKYKDYLERK